MAGYAGLEGTRRLWEARREELLARFPSFFLRTLEEEEADIEAWRRAHPWRTVRAEKAAGTARPEEPWPDKNALFTAWEQAGEGGIFTALWNFSGVYGAGIDVDMQRIPMRQVTVEICELYGLNPYRLLCADCFLFAAQGGLRLAESLREAGIEAALIGSITEGTARQIRSGEEKNGYLERPRTDEWVRFCQSGGRPQTNGG